MDLKLSTILGQALGGGALAGALLLILYKMSSRIVERLIASIDRIAAKVDDGAKRDAEVKEAVVRVEAKLDTAIDLRGPRPGANGRRH